MAALPEPLCGHCFAMSSAVGCSLGSLTINKLSTKICADRPCGASLWCNHDIECSAFFSERPKFSLQIKVFNTDAKELF